jgi:hypothetical protein
VICYQHKTIHLSDVAQVAKFRCFHKPELWSGFHMTELDVMVLAVANITVWSCKGLLDFSGNCSKFVLNWIQLCSPHWLTDWLHLNAASNFLWQDLKTGFNTFKIQTSFLRCLWEHLSQRLEPLTRTRTIEVPTTWAWRRKSN